MYFCYILYSKSLDKFYVGSCSDLENRIRKHNLGHATFTSTGIPWELKWSRSFETNSLALQFEKSVKKKKSRIYIEKLIKETWIEIH